MGGSPALMWPQLLWPVWRATVPPMFHLKPITTKTNMPLRKTWRNSTAWSLMNQEKMMLKLLECFCHDICLFLKMENQLLRFLDPALPNWCETAKIESARWLKIKVRTQMSSASHLVHLFFVNAGLLLTICPVPHAKTWIGMATLLMFKKSLTGGWVEKILAFSITKFPQLL